MRVRLGIAVAMVSAVAAASAGTARAGTSLIVTGHGWGHGVGMSQWGAYGYALHGWKYRRILSHYYPGTTMGHVGEVRVRVLLAQGASSVTVGLRDAADRHRRPASDPHAPAGTYGVGPRLVLPVRKKGRGSPSDTSPSSTAPARRSRTTGVSTTARSPPKPGRTRLGRQRPLAGHVPARRRPLGVAVALACRGPRGAGGRRPFVCDRATQAELLVRPGADDGRPGLRRRQGRDAALGSRRLRDARRRC